MAKQQMLTVGVVGAGISGLTAAIALRRAGWDVEIFEKSTFSNESGAGILLGCNATKVLRSWGIDVEPWLPSEIRQLRVPNAETLAPEHEESFPEFNTRYGEKWLSFHRQDLHGGLLAAATSSELHPGEPVKLSLGTAISNIDPQAGRITLASGAHIYKDLLIIANGVRTNFQSAIVGYENPLIVAPISVYRCLVPIASILDDSSTRPLLADGRPSLLTLKHNESAICASYPVRSESMLSISYVHPTKAREQGIVDWSTTASESDINESFPDFHSAIRALPRKAVGQHNKITCYPVITRREIPTFVNGRALLLGDAAHPMFTFHGQGASMAIESCGALEVFFRTLSDSDAIPRRLNMLNEFRHGRCVATQLMSNGAAGALRNEDILSRIRLHYDGPLPPADTKPWGQGFRDFFFGYDVIRESNLFLEKRATSKSLEAHTGACWFWWSWITKTTKSPGWSDLRKQPTLLIVTWFRLSCVFVLGRIRQFSNLHDCAV